MVLKQFFYVLKENLFICNLEGKIKKGTPNEKYIKKKL